MSKLRTTLAILISTTCLCLCIAVSAEAASISLLLNSKTITGVANGDPLNTWIGEVGSATATVAPTFISSSSNLNNMPVVRFDADDDGMATSLTQTSGSYTVLTLFAPLTVNTNSQRVLNGGAGASTQNWLVGPYGGKYRHYASGWVDGFNTNYTLAPALMSVTNTAIGSGTSELIVDGVDITGNSSPNGAFGQLGLGEGGQNAEAANSDVALVLAFDMALSADERIGVEYLIAQNFGLSGYSATTEQIGFGNTLLAGTSLVPEPSSIMLAGTLLMGLALLVRRRLRG